MIRMTLRLQANEKADRQWGSAFHGMLMSILPSECASFLHGEGQHLLSQWIQPQSANQLCWRIMLLEDEIGCRVADAIATAPYLYSKDRRQRFDVLDSRIEQQDLYEWLDNNLCAGAVSTNTLRICTPATHKSAGRYVSLPTADLIFRSLNHKLCAVCPDFALAERDTEEQFLATVQVGRYMLSSATYGVGGAYVLGYEGKLSLSSCGDEAFRRIANALVLFAPWCGLGAKTALGMGGCLLEMKTHHNG